MKRRRRRSLTEEQARLERLASRTKGYGWTRWWSFSRMARELNVTVEEVQEMVDHSHKVACFKGWTLPKCPASDFKFIPYSDDVGDWLIKPMG